MALALAGSGCSTVRSSAIATGPTRLPPRTGAVGIYVAGEPPHAESLGIVEVHASGDEGNVETLLPEFARRVAGLGGNGAVVDHVIARFAIVERLVTETYTYPCGYFTCTGTRMFPAYEEVMTVTMTGKAVKVP
jgi:hypothetical protein